MKKSTLALSAAVAALAGTVVYAAAPAGDAGMTRAEVVAKANEMWAMMDVNKDGVINAADRDASRAQMFDRIDTNKDGSISRDEFNAAHPTDGKMGDRMGQPDPHHGPDGHGPDGHHGPGMGDGMNPGTMKMGMMLLHMADTNTDGSVTRAEFDAAVKQHFDEVDANKDGTITSAERRAAHAKMRQHMRQMGPGPMGGAPMGEAKP